MIKVPEKASCKIQLSKSDIFFFAKRQTVENFSSKVLVDIVRFKCCTGYDSDLLAVFEKIVATQPNHYKNVIRN